MYVFSFILYEALLENEVECRSNTKDPAVIIIRFLSLYDWKGMTRPRFIPSPSYLLATTAQPSTSMLSTNEYGFLFIYFFLIIQVVSGTISTENGRRY